jgi:hypothetical protein
VPGWLLALVSIIAIVGFATWRLTMSSPGEAAPAHAPSPAAVPPASKGEPSPPAVTRIVATMQLDSPTWMEVTADGMQVTSTTHPPQQLVFHAKHDLLVWLGHGSGVTLTVNGKDVSLAPNSAKYDITLRNGHVSIGPA